MLNFRIAENKVFCYRVLQCRTKNHIRGTVFEETVMKNFDVKSCVIGLLLGVCLMLAVGAGGNGSSEVGRYRISAAGDAVASCFVIDTATGRTWRRITSTQGTCYGCPADWEKDD